MDIETVKSILQKADPNRNSSVHERQNALRMAEREMDKNGWSFASLGFSHEDAERIANQFSVTTGKNQNKEHSSFGLGFFRGSQSAVSTGIQRREPKTIYVPKSKPVIRKEEPYESYTERCEREDRVKWDLKYDEMNKYQKQQERERAEMAIETDKVTRVLVIITLIVIGLVIYFAVIKPLAM